MNARTIQVIAVPCFLIFVLMAAGANSAAGQTTSHEEFEGADSLQKRIEYFYGQRAYPLAHIPTGARLRALRQLSAMKAAANTRSANATAAQPAATAAAPAWGLLGPKHILPAQGQPYWGAPKDSGRLSAIAVDPTNRDVVYVGAAEGGVWKSTDGGSTWTALTDSQPSLAVGSIAIDPTNPSTIYVGTGEADNGSDNYSGAGILKSTDGGNTWSQLGANQFTVCASGSGSLNSYLAGAYIGSIAVDPANNQVLLAAVIDSCTATSNGIYQSMDGGATWANVLNSPDNAPGSSVVFVVNPTPLGTTTTAYAALGDAFGSASDGVYISTSTNNGATWSTFAPANGTGSNVLPTGSTVGRILLAAAPTNVNTLYAAVANTDDTFRGVYKTVDGGANWLLTNAPDFCSKQCNYNLAIAVSPVNEKIVYGAGIYNFNTNTATTVIGSTDGGNTWTPVGSSTGAGAGMVHTDAHALAFASDGNRLFVGSDGGAWRTDKASDPAKLNWTDVNDGLFTAQFYPGFAFDGASDAIGGTQDNGTIIRDKTSGEWSNTQCGDGGYAAIDTTTNPATFYAACNMSQGIWKTTTPLTPSAWTEADSGISSGDPRQFIPPMVMDLSNPSTLYYGTNRVYQTTNGGASWVSISPQPLPGSTGSVSAIAVAPSNPNVVYAGTSDGKVASGVGSTWANVTGTGLPGRYVTQVRVDPNIATTAYVTYSGFSGFDDSLGHIFKSTHVSASGTSWIDISGNLPNIPVNDLLIDSALNTLYAATDIGVFASTNGGATWSTFGTGLPNVVVLSLFLEPTGRTLAAATHGRAAWTITLPKAPKPVASNKAPHAKQIAKVTTLPETPAGTLAKRGTDQ